MTNKEKILITGGAGYIGSTLVGLLMHEGYTVRVVDNLMHDPKSVLTYVNNPSFQFILGDLNDERVRNSVLEGINSVVHLAAIVGDPACSKNPEFSMKNNYGVTQALVDQSKSKGIQRFIFSSTCSNYGIKSDDEICTEETSVNPVSVYAVSKVKSEEYLLRKATNEFVPTSLRFSTVFGVSSRMRFDLLISDFTKEAVTKGEVLVYGEQFWRPYLHVRDISRAIVDVLQAESKLVSGQVFNVGNNKMNYRKKEIADLVQQEVPDAKFSFVRRDNDPRSYRVDFSKIQNILGFEPTKSIKDGIREVKAILESGVIVNPEDKIYYN
ncbi:MAG: NAD(P)-dependent oxidoreductase [Nanoarchaeota archaeon]|nr:NAD(P)-dependent oxidoreductase [Nanoarchaeota archaeon]MBU1623164.1 NAD(P)-dependent oxidoreductase [Nanoarchaeota archaeon]